MTKGYSLHIGLNFVDPDHYNGWDGKLTAPEFDALDMQQICKDEGFETQVLLREQATLKKVIESIDVAAMRLDENDFFCITFSGHGGQIPDKNNDEDDLQDETWCLFDGQLIDDALAVLWSKFKENVRILVISDSCHSGTVTKLVSYKKSSLNDHTPKFMPNEVAVSTYLKNKGFYDGIQTGLPKNPEIKASVKLISGCQDNQYSYDGTFNGQFTARLKRIWNAGLFSGDYKKFHKEIVNLLPEYQTPNYYKIGASNNLFDQQRPFTI